MQTLLISLSTVALAEIGDKTQLLSLVLAAKFRRPWSIVLGILAATLVNHALAGALGELLGNLLTPSLQRWLVGLSFLGMALWTLKPDRLDAGADALPGSGRGVFVATAIAFFLAEMGDKTQIATMVLAADFRPLWQVVLGTTLGMLAANAPVVWLGARFAGRLPLRAARLTAATLFAALGLWILLIPR